MHDRPAARRHLLNTALNTADVINPILNATSPAIATAFTGLSTSIANQLKQVARLIEGRSVLGAKRQFFFVSLGDLTTIATSSSCRGICSVNWPLR